MRPEPVPNIVEISKDGTLIAEPVEVLTFSVDVGDESDRKMMIFVSHEGIVMDVYENDLQLGTTGMMYDEWADWVLKD